MKIKLTDQ